MSNSIMRKIAKFIVEKHIIIMLLFVVLVIYSALSISKVRVNEDITALLPPKTATSSRIMHPASPNRPPRKAITKSEIPMITKVYPPMRWVRCQLCSSFSAHGVRQPKV